MTILEAKQRYPELLGELCALELILAESDEKETVKALIELAEKELRAVKRVLRIEERNKGYE